MDKSFTFESSVVEEEVSYDNNPLKSGYIRSKKDNTLLPDQQVKDLLPLVTEDCINWVDSDGIAYKTASSVEDDYIEVVNTITNHTKTHDNITKFKGGLRKAGAISDDSWLGTYNIKQAAEGNPTFTLEDFTITPKKKLKFEKGTTIDGKTFDSSLAVACYYVDQWYDAIREQTQISNVKPVLGEGDCHRHELLLHKQYKGSRIGAPRPLLLKQVREYIVNNYDTKMAPEGFEADEVVDAYGMVGYRNYMTTGKFNHIKTSNDKDAMNMAGILFNYDKGYLFKYPQPWLIEDIDVSVGYLQLEEGKKLKGVGLKHSVMQMVLKDSADEYGSRAYLPAAMKPKSSYAEVGFYKAFHPLTTQKEVLQLMVNLFSEWFPKGLQYTAWEGTEVNEDTLWWMETLFSCMYMKLSPRDSTKLIDWLDRFEVDYGHLIGNNPRTRDKVADNDTVKRVDGDMTEAIRSIKVELEFKTSDSKGVLQARLKEATLKLEQLSEIKVELYE